MNSWLKAHLLPCPFKYITGIDCPGCGFQRSLLALLKGDVHQSFLLYPPAIPLLIMAAWWLADSIFKLDTRKSLVKKTMFIVVALIIAVSYTLKMAHL
nr:DUF2752 domain-containing protein [Mucilaginibacter sp. L294]